MTEHNAPIRRRGRKHRYQISAKNIQAGPNPIKEIKTANTKSVSIVAVILVVGFVAVMAAIPNNPIWNAFDNVVDNINADPMYCRTDISDHSCYKTEDVCVCGKKACDKSVAFNNINGTFVCQDQSSVYCTADIGLVCVDSKAEGKKLENRVIVSDTKGTGLDWVKTNRHDLDVFCRNREDSGTCQ
jgi:hypothetical protein